MKSSRGLTLLEVLLALAILGGAGFALAIKLPLDFQAKRLELTATVLLSDLRDARQAAMAENTWYQVKFFRYDKYYRILKQGTKVKDVPLQEGINFYNTLPDLTFNAVGNPIPGMTISLVNQKGQKRNVIVAPVTGRIREE